MHNTVSPDTKPTVKNPYVVSAHSLSLYTVPETLRISDVLYVVKANEATVARGPPWPLSEGWLPGEPGTQRGKTYNPKYPLTAPIL